MLISRNNRIELNWIKCLQSFTQQDSAMEFCKISPTLAQQKWIIECKKYFLEIKTVISQALEVWIYEMLKKRKSEKF